MRYLGIDLAWGENNRTGLAELDSEGRLLKSASVQTDDEIAAFLGDRGRGLVAAIDAPLIVANEAGQRPCERKVGRLFSRFNAGAYPANRGNPAFNPEPRGARLAHRFGWDLDPAVRPQPDRSVAIEVYPHPAMVSLFELTQVIPYKRKQGRDVPARQDAFDELFTSMQATCGSLLHLESSARWQELRGQVRDSPRQVDLDRVEDEVDAIFCAYLAWLWANDANSMTVLGDFASGYIVTPMPPDLADPQRVYQVDPSAGEVRFGDGVQGRRPALGRHLADGYGTGGGADGDVPTTPSPTESSQVKIEPTSVEPTGRCFCGCGQATRPGRYFVAYHDRKAETTVIKERYGSIAAFVVAHGYGPDHSDSGRQE